MLGQRRYLPSYVNKGFPTSTLSCIYQRSDVIGRDRNSQILVNLLVTSVPRLTGSNAKTLGLKHLQFPHMEASDGPPDGVRVEHHRKDELLAQQNTIPHEQTTSPV